VVQLANSQATPSTKEKNASWKRAMLLTIAITLHNIPEGQMRKCAQPLKIWDQYLGHLSLAGMENT
jgi:hypothetical protein